MMLAYLIETFIQENLFGFCVDIYDMNITASSGSVGAFNYNGDDFGISQGVILSTGNVENAVGPNNSTCISSSHDSSGDPISTLLQNLSAFILFFFIKRLISREIIPSRALRTHLMHA